MKEPTTIPLPKIRYEYNEPVNKQEPFSFVTLALPAWVAAALAIISALKTLYDLFKKEDTSWLDDLRNQLNVIIDLLEDVIDILNRLDVIIREAVRDELLVFLRSELGAYIIEYREIVKTIELDPDYDASTRLKDLYENTREVSRRVQTYGYAHCHTVCLCYLVESGLATASNAPIPAVIPRVETYEDFFTKSIDKNAKGSVAWAIDRKTNEVNDMRRILDEARTGSTDEYYSYDQGPFICTVKFRITISGSVDDGWGFTVEALEKKCRGNPEGPPRADVDLLSIRLPSDAVRKHDQLKDQTRQYVESLHAKRNEYFDAKNGLEILKKTHDQVDEYLDLAKEYLRKHQIKSVE